MIRVPKTIVSPAVIPIVPAPTIPTPRIIPVWITPSIPTPTPTR